MMPPASGFVHFRRTNYDHRIVVMGGFPINQALGAGGGLTANHADCG
jgi:hypothetical protein